MYEDLVKSLRTTVKLYEAVGQDGLVTTQLIKQAADAIEELVATAGTAYNELANNEANKPRWIPVTERLPDAYEDVLLQFPNNQAAGFCDRDGCWGVYSGDGFYTEVADNEPKPTHWAKKLPEPPKEEA